MTTQQTPRLATVLSRSTGHYLIDGQTGRTVLHASPGNALVIYKLANARGYKLVNEGSIKGQAILDRIHSHAPVRPKPGTIEPLKPLPVYK